MDLVSGVQRVVMVMEQCARSGEPKILERCTLPLTGVGVVDLIISELCGMTVDKAQGGLTLMELAPGVTVEAIAAKTAAAFAKRV